MITATLFDIKKFDTRWLPAAQREPEKQPPDRPRGGVQRPGTGSLMAEHAVVPEMLGTLFGTAEAGDPAAARRQVSTDRLIRSHASFNSPVVAGCAVGIDAIREDLSLPFAIAQER